MPTITLSHGDSVSGMTIIDDGISPRYLVLWSEGRDSRIHLITENKTIEDLSATSQHPIVERLDYATQVEEVRPMTPTEERIYDILHTCLEREE